MHEAIQKIQASEQLLRDEHAPSDEAGKLTERAAAALRDSGGIRLLQSKQHGGYQADLTDFYAWVRSAARYNPSAGWVAGVVGVHPWQIAICDAKLQAEIYGNDVDTWVASPYAPIGRAKPVDGGFLFSGEWPYSTGTDYCDWVVLGGMVTDADGEVPMPPEVRHFFLPRSDYEIVEGSWNVMGLMGTGSKNVRVKHAFVPDYRTVGHVPLCDGEYNVNQPDAPLYHLPFGGVFSAAICSATFGIARGTLDAYLSQLPTRVSVTGLAGTPRSFPAGRAGRGRGRSRRRHRAPRRDDRRHAGARRARQSAHARHAARFSPQPGACDPARAALGRPSVVTRRLCRGVVDEAGRALLARSAHRRHARVQRHRCHLQGVGESRVPARRHGQRALLITVMQANAVQRPMQSVGPRQPTCGFSDGDARRVRFIVRGNANQGRRSGAFENAPASAVWCSELR